MNRWAQKKCAPCEGGTEPVPEREVRVFLRDLPDWILSGDAKSIYAEYRLKDFMEGVRLIGRIAEIAESEDHHPDVHLTGYRRLRIELATHSIGGLSENDFILAAKIDALPKNLKTSA
ncbi:MAG: 4a-hydroxytetrahydrobiopterin dehydratase [Candidatus Omnitrophica bacterium]|nr:4a-hydroxytetrahydrobiopterin dehydratase [Candidatus Omnitrophota bacterium]